MRLLPPSNRPAPWARDDAPRFPLLVLALLLAAVGIAYWPVLGNDFFLLDDVLYITGNPRVHSGLTWAGVRWAFSTMHATNWHPLTWLSHMLDVELFGLDPAAHHLMNVALHALNALLLVLALRRMTGLFWPPFLVAALFALHPMRVESVAWASERKDVLAGTFFALTLWAHALHARRPSASRYAAVVASLALGLMAKPTLVTVPCLLLLLDVWPLQRFRRAAPPGVPASRLILEKLPLFALSALSCGITYLSQSSGGAVADTRFGLSIRASNALASCVQYLLSTSWPTRLAFFYPHPAVVSPDSYQPWTLVTLACGLLVAGLLAVALLGLRRWPYLSVGILWFLGMLVPTMGLVQAGLQARADRYSYLPSIGIYIALVWAVAQVVSSRRALRLAAGASACLALVACTSLTRREVRYWHDAGTLGERALEVTEKNFVAHDLLGVMRSSQGEHEEALRHLQECLAIKPSYSIGRAHLGMALLEMGRRQEAILHLEQALAQTPRMLEARVNLGIARFREGDLDGAEQSFRTVLELDDQYAIAHFNLGLVQLRRGNLAPARASLERALRIDPLSDDALNALGVLELGQKDFASAIHRFQTALQHEPQNWEALANLGEALFESGRSAEAVVALRRAAEGDPSSWKAANRLAWILATSPDPELRDPRAALRIARACNEATGFQRPVLLETLAAAHAAGGDFEEALRVQERALSGLPPEMRPAAAARLEDYRSGRPARP